MKSVLVTGAGGFIGGHLVARLREHGGREHPRRRPGAARRVAPALRRRGQPFGRSPGLRQLPDAPSRASTPCSTWPPTWAAWASSRTTRPCACCRCSSPRTCSRRHGTPASQRLFYSSSACVYAAGKQESPEVEPLREADAYPAMPEDGYGWEKLFSERMARHYYEDFGLETRVARYHNVYGPLGTYDGGREKAPAAICRKVATAVLSGTNEIEIWGDGEQTRSFTYIDDCVEGTLKLTASDVREPLNIGSRAAGHDQRARRHRRRHRRRHAEAQLQPRRRPKASVVATATTRSSASASAGRRPSPSRTGCRRRTTGSSTR